MQVKFPNIGLRLKAGIHKQVQQHLAISGSHINMYLILDGILLNLSLSPKISLILGIPKKIVILNHYYKTISQEGLNHLLVSENKTLLAP